MTGIDAAKRRVVIGDDDQSLTRRAGLSLVAEVDRVRGVAEAVEISLGWLKACRRGLGGWQGVVVRLGADARRGRLRCVTWTICGPSARGVAGAGRAARAPHVRPAVTTGRAGSC